MPEQALGVRVDELERRMARVESRLGFKATPVGSNVVLDDLLRVRNEWGERSRRPAPPPIPTAPPAQPIERPAFSAVPELPLTPPAPAQRPPPVAGPFPQPVQSTQEEHDGGDGGATLEQTIGLKLAGWVGAIVVVIAAAFGIKYAVDQGWFSVVPPAARLALMSLGGFGMIALGEVVYRRLGALASAALFGAGVATLFVVSYAGHAYYRLYPRDAAFLMMGATTLVGTAVALRGNLVSIAVLSLVGGNIAPLVLADTAPHLVPFLSYLLMLQVVALFLSARGRHGKWWTLRGVSFATIALWVTALLLGNASNAQPYGPVMWFGVIYAVLFQAELIFSAGRRPAASRTPQNTGATFSTLVTAALALMLLCVFWHDPRLARGGWTLVLAATCGAAGLLLARRPSSDVSDMAPGAGLHALSLGYRFQSAALFMAAVPITLSGVWVSLAWGAFAVAFAVLGAARDLNDSRRVATGVWWLAALYFVAWTLNPLRWSSGGPPPGAPLLHLFGHSIPIWAAVAAMLAVIGHAIAALVHENWTAAALAETEGHSSAQGGTLAYESRATPRTRAPAVPELQPLSGLLAVAAAVLWVAAALMALPPLGATAALLAGALLLLGTGRLVSIHSAPSSHGAALLGIAAIKWLAFDTLHRRLLPGWSATEYPRLLNASVAVAAALLGTIASLGRILPGADDRSTGTSSWAPYRRSMHFLGVLIVLWAGTLEIDRYFQAEAAIGAATRTLAAFADPLRAEQAALSVWGSLFAVACVALGFARRAAPLRYFGLGLFAITLLKVFMVDLHDVGTGYRILSLLGLGTLLIGTSLLYAKLTPILLREPEAVRPD